MNDLNDSIFMSIKKLCGIDNEYTDFDADILMHINTVLSILQQLGVGPKDGFFIEDASTTWTDYLGSDSRHLNMVKSYMAAKVRLMFDAPVSSSLMESLNRTCNEFEWRMNVAAENHDWKKEETEG